MLHGDQVNENIVWRNEKKKINNEKIIIMIRIIIRIIITIIITITIIIITK